MQSIADMISRGAKAEAGGAPGDSSRPGARRYWTEKELLMDEQPYKYDRGSGNLGRRLQGSGGGDRVGSNTALFWELPHWVIPSAVTCLLSTPRLQGCR